MNAATVAEAFLRKNDMHPDSIDPDAFKAAYIAEMQKGLRGEKSSLLMLPTYLSAGLSVPETAQAVAVDIGGTNLKIAVLRFSDGRFNIIKSDVSRVPGLSGELTKDAFFEKIAERILPFAGDAGCIGICFSHAAEILPDLDGRLISFSKELRVTNAEGVRITREISEKLAGLGVRDRKTYTLLNDSAAVVLSGAALSQGYDGLIGFVLGTGMNLSYLEKAPEIKKLGGGYSADTMVINTETGSFSALPVGRLDAAFDAETSDPESHRLEKMASGRYLGDLILFTLKKATEESVLSSEASASVFALDALATQEAGAYLAGQSSILDTVSGQEDDRAVLKTVTDLLFERAAKLSALTVAAVLDKTGAGRTPSRPAVVVAEGSTVNRLYSMQERFMKNLRRAAGGRHFKLLTPEDATFYGTALAAFRNV